MSFINLSNIEFSGDEFALREGGLLYCKDDHDNLEKSAQSRVAPIIESNNNTHLNNNNHSSEIGSMSGKHRVHIFFFCFIPLQKYIDIETSRQSNLIQLTNKRLHSPSNRVVYVKQTLRAN